MNRLSLPFVWLFLQRKGGQNRFGPRTTSFLRCIIIFSLSAILHVGILYSIPPVPHIRRSVLEPGMIKFFLSQPFGLLFEVMIVNPLTETLPRRWKVVLRSSVFWVWIAGTGRWYADGWVLSGQYERVMFDFSPAQKVLGR